MDVDRNKRQCLQGGEVFGSECNAFQMNLCLRLFAELFYLREKTTSKLARAFLRDSGWRNCIHDVPAVFAERPAAFFWDALGRFQNPRMNQLEQGERGFGSGDMKAVRHQRLKDDSVPGAQGDFQSGNVDWADAVGVADMDAGMSRHHAS